MKLIREFKKEYKISDANDVYQLLKEFENEDREHYVVLGLDSKNKVMFREIVAIGILNETIIHPRETFKKAIMMSCNAIIMAHNHPSGECEPSEADDEMTKQMADAGKILGIPVLDHLIVGKNGFYSYNSHNKI